MQAVYAAWVHPKAVTAQWMIAPLLEVEEHVLGVASAAIETSSGESVEACPEIGRIA